MKTPLLTKKRIVIATLILLAISLFGFNWILELRAEEPRRAIVAMEMMVNNDYVTPTINGWNYYNKPPVFNWLLVVFFTLFGSMEEWVVRLPSLLSFVLMGIANFWLVKKYLNKEIAVLSTLFLYTSGDLLFYGTVNSGEIDLFFSLLVFLQVGSIFYFFDKKKYLLMFLVSYVFCAIGTLTKGPPSVAFQGLTLLAWMIVNKRFLILFSWKHIVSFALFLGIVIGYFMLYNQSSDGSVFATRLFKEASQRTGAEYSLLQTIGGFFAFVPFLLKLILPWSFLIFFVVRKDVFARIKSKPILLFSLVFFVSNIWLYWITPDHKARYIYMFLPFLLVIFAYFYVFKKENQQRLNKVIESIFLGIIILVSAGILALPFLPLEVNPVLVIVFFVASGSLAYLYFKNNQVRIYLFIFFVVFVRLMFNGIYLNHQNKLNEELSYEKHVTKMIEIVDNQSILYFGYPHKLFSDASIGPFKFEEIEVSTAQLIAYQIPYYYTKETGKLLKFETSLLPNQFYLGRKPQLRRKNIEVYYEFWDDWQKFDMILFKKK